MLSFSDDIRYAMADAILSALDAGPTPALLRIYSGTRPATTEDAVTDQLLLGTLSCSQPAGNVTTGQFTFGTITADTAADADGTASWFRIVTGTDFFSVMDGSITTTGGGGDLTLNTIDIVAGGPISITGTSSITIGNV